MGIIRELIYRTPLQNIIVPSVAIKEGIPVLTTKSPFKKPKRAPVRSVAKRITMSGAPHSRSFTNMKELIGIMEPTDRSNSPHIMRVPTPSATIPRSGVSLANIRRLLGPMKLCLGVKIPKMNNKALKTIRVDKTLYESNRVRIFCNNFTMPPTRRTESKQCPIQSRNQASSSLGIFHSEMRSIFICKHFDR